MADPQNPGQFNPMFDDSRVQRDARKTPHSLGNADKHRQHLEDLKQGDGRAKGAGSLRSTQGQFMTASTHSHAPGHGHGHGHHPERKQHAPAVQAVPSAGAQQQQPIAPIVTNNNDMDRQMQADALRQQQQAQQPDVFEQEYQQAMQGTQQMFGGVSNAHQQATSTGHYVTLAPQQEVPIHQHPAPANQPTAVQDDDFDF